MSTLELTPGDVIRHTKPLHAWYVKVGDVSVVVVCRDVLEDQIEDLCVTYKELTLLSCRTGRVVTCQMSSQMFSRFFERLI